MVYQGSKSRIRKYISPIIQRCIYANNVKTYIEPFVGGGNMITAIDCMNRIGSDLDEDLICLLNYMKENPDLKIFPNVCSKEHFYDVKQNRITGKYSKEYVSGIGHFATFGGRYFNSGYARDPSRKRNIYFERLTNARKQASYFKDISFNCCDYKTYLSANFKDCVFYLDPPYRNTMSYANQKIDYDEFYDFCKKIGKNNFVFISEYNMPDDFQCVWKYKIKCSFRTKSLCETEKLFYFGKKNNIEILEEDKLFDW